MLIDYVVCFCPKRWLGAGSSMGGHTFMIALFEKTLLLWWLLGGLVVLRWFHGICVADPLEARDSSDHDDNEYTVPGPLASRT